MIPEAIWEMIKWCGIIICFFYSLYLFLKYVTLEEENKDNEGREIMSERNGVKAYIDKALHRTGVKP